MKHTLIALHEIIIEPLLTGSHIVGQQLHAIHRTDGEGGIQFVVVSALTILALHHLEFTALNFDEEIAVAASRFQESGVDTLRLFLHQVEHSIHLTLGGINFSMLRHSLTRNYLSLIIRILIVYHVLVGHLKINNT